MRSRISLQTVNLDVQTLIGCEQMARGKSEDKLRETTINTLSSGGWRTIRSHVYNWLRIEKWYQEEGDSADSIYPIVAPTIARCIASLVDRGCGVSTPSNIRVSCMWIATRLGIPVEGNLYGATISGLIDKVMKLKVLQIKKQPFYCINTVQKMEIYMAIPSVSVSEKCLVGWILCLIYAALRGDDLVHSPPKYWELTDRALYGLAWQTKVDRKRRGTRLAIPKTSISNVDCVTHLYELLRDHTTDFLERDYFMDLPNDDFTGFLEGIVMTTDNVRPLIAKVLTRLGAEPSEIAAKSTHMAKRTFVNAMFHHGESSIAMNVFGHWKSPDTRMSFTYAQNIVEMPIEMLGRLTKDLRSGWRPQSDPFVDDHSRSIKISLPDHKKAIDDTNPDTKPDDDEQTLTDLKEDIQERLQECILAAKNKGTASPTTPIHDSPDIGAGAITRAFSNLEIETLEQSDSSDIEEDDDTELPEEMINIFRQPLTMGTNRSKNKAHLAEWGCTIGSKNWITACKRFDYNELEGKFIYQKDASLKILCKDCCTKRHKLFDKIICKDLLDSLMIPDTTHPLGIS
jgi:hypothetical protein